MKLTPWLFGSLTTVALAACGGNKSNNGTAGSGTETGTMQGGAATTSDTGMARTDTTAGGTSGMSSDSSSRMRMDTSRTETNGGAAASGKPNRSTGEGVSNQTKSGVTNTKTGKSTLGPGVTKTRPDQGQPVTAKGDTVSSGPDSNATNR
jgi:hypothetical protein